MPKIKVEFEEHTIKFITCRLENLLENEIEYYKANKLRGSDEMYNLLGCLCEIQKQTNDDGLLEDIKDYKERINKVIND